MQPELRDVVNHFETLGMIKQNQLSRFEEVYDPDGRDSYRVATFKYSHTSKPIEVYLQVTWDESHPLTEENMQHIDLKTNASLKFECVHMYAPNYHLDFVTTEVLLRAIYAYIEHYSLV